MIGPEHERELVIFSDYICPFCYFVSHQLDRLLSAHVAAQPTDRWQVRWEPFEVHPETPPGGLAVEDLQFDEEYLAFVEQLARQYAAEHDVTLRFPTRMPNTRLAHLACAFARRQAPDLLGRFHRAIFEAYWLSGRDIGDQRVLIDLAGRSGVDTAALDRFVASDDAAGVLARARHEARRYGVDSVPSMVVGGRVLVGLQPDRTVREVLFGEAAQR